MLSNIHLYSETRKKLIDSGLEGRILEKKDSDDGLPHLPHISDYELPGIAKSMKDDGFYECIPTADGFDELYKMTMNNLFKGERRWTVKTLNGTKDIKSDAEDIAMFLGFNASFILDKREIWDYRRFGFSSPIEFISAVSVRMHELNHSIREKGLLFIVRQKDGTEWETDISGNLHYDLSVMQEDITEYETHDPFGFKVGLRPSVTGRGISPRDSCEPTFMKIVLKYIEQENISTSLFEDYGKKLIEWGRSLGQRGGATAEHLFGGQDISFPILFSSYERDIPELDANYSIRERSIYGLPAGGGYFYNAFIGPDRELVFKTKDYEAKDAKTSNERIRCIFPQENIDDLLKAIIYQCARGLGRTPASSILSVIDYKLSGKYDEDKIRFAEFNNHQKI